MKNLNKITQLFEVEYQNATYHPKEAPFVMSRAKGSQIFDVEDNSYLDLSAGFGALPFGHNPDFLKTKLAHFLSEDQIIHTLGDLFPGQHKINFLSEIVKDFTTIFGESIHGGFAVTGSQAVELALKTVMLATKKIGVIAFKEAYHGLDLGVLPVVGRLDFKEFFQPWIKQDQVEFVAFNADERELKAACDALTKKGYPPGCILLEPCQGRGGVNLPQPGWLKTLRNFCDQNDLLLVYDEILVGLGRCGRLSFSEEVVPDLLCLGKAIGGGFPLSLCLGKKSIMTKWPVAEAEPIHTGTFFGHNLSCFAGHVTYQEIKKQNLVQQSKSTGLWFKMQTINTLAEKFKDLIKEIRGEGLLVAIEFKQPGLAAQLMDDLRKKEKVIVVPCGQQGHILSFTPALNISQNELQLSLDALKRTLEKI